MKHIALAAMITSLFFTQVAHASFKVAEFTFLEVGSGKLTIKKSLKQFSPTKNERVKLDDKKTTSIRNGGLTQNQFDTLNLNLGLGLTK